MAVSCLAGAFNTGVGTVSSTIDVTGDITISGTSAVVFYWTGGTASVDSAGRATKWRGMGFAVSSTDRRCSTTQDQDAGASHIGGSYHSNAACIASVPTGTAADGLLDFDSWLSNGFRLIVDDVMPRDQRIGFIIYTGLTNAATGQWQDQGSTGNYIVTTALAFQPDVEILISTTIDTTPPGGRAGNENLGMGFAISSSLQATLCAGSDEGSATSDTDSYCNDVDCLSSETAACGSVLATRFTFVSQNSNGFTVNQLLIPATITWNHFLAMQGGSWDIESIATRTDGNDITTGALGFTPAGALIISAMKAESSAGTMTVHDTWSIGAANSATSRYAAAAFSLDGNADTVVYTAQEHDEVYIAITQSTSPAVEGLMDVKTWADPLIFVMDDADPSAKFVTMLVVGNSGSFSVTPGDGFQAQTGDAAGVRANYLVTPADGFQAQTGDASVVRANYPVTPVDGFQAQTGDAAGVSYEPPVINVTPADGFQAQTGDTAGVSAAYPVTPIDGAQTQIGDICTVNADYSITPADGFQTQTGDTAIVYAAYVLTPAEGAQTQIGDEATLTAEGAGLNVTPADGFQAQTGDAAIVSTNYSVTPIDGFQTQSGDIAVVYATYSITPEEGAQTQSGDVPAVFSAYILNPAQGFQAQTGDIFTITLNEAGVARTGPTASHLVMKGGANTLSGGNILVIKDKTNVATIPQPLTIDK